MCFRIISHTASNLVGFRHPQAAQHPASPRHAKRHSLDHGATPRHTRCRTAPASTIPARLIRAPASRPMPPADEGCHGPRRDPCHKALRNRSSTNRTSAHPELATSGLRGLHKPGAPLIGITSGTPDSISHTSLFQHTVRFNPRSTRTT